MTSKRNMDVNVNVNLNVNFNIRETLVMNVSSYECDICTYTPM